MAEGSCLTALHSVPAMQLVWAPAALAADTHHFLHGRRKPRNNARVNAIVPDDAERNFLLIAAAATVGGWYVNENLARVWYTKGGPGGSREPSLEVVVGSEAIAYFTASTTYRRIVFWLLSRWGARSVQAFDL